MVTYKHTIWLRNFQNFRESKHYENVKIFFLFIVLFAIISLFMVRIVRALDEGLTTQQRIDTIAGEVNKLEKENSALQHEKLVYLSESEIDAQYRALENKKKEGEKVYLVSIANQDAKTSENSSKEEAITREPKKLTNWEKWFTKVFQ
jgi:hypothetical protein